MSVIGRLDDQVDAVLIAPLDKNNQRTTEPQAPTEGRSTAPPHHGAHTPEEADQSKSNNQALRSELPVWLL
jgi:hypothetical protein